MHREGGEGGGGHAQEIENREHKCIFIRTWQVNTGWQQCCHAGRGHSEALKCSVAGRPLGPGVGSCYSSMAHVLNSTTNNLLRFTYFVQAEQNAS